MKNIENKELYREIINGKIIKVEALNDELLLVFGDDRTMRFFSTHSQDCCENVYADFSQINYYKENLVDNMVRELIIKGVSDMGFLLCFYFDYDKGEKVFIPCYNEQNGYYSSDLDLIIHSNGEVKKINITEFIEDRID